MHDFLLAYPVVICLGFGVFTYLRARQSRPVRVARLAIVAMVVNAILAALIDRVDEDAGLVAIAATLPIGVVAVILGNAALYFVPRHISGICSCGYDLTGNTSGHCPECGNETAAGRTAAHGVTSASSSSDS